MVVWCTLMYEEKDNEGTRRGRCAFIGILRERNGAGKKKRAAIDVASRIKEKGSKSGGKAVKIKA